GAGPIHFIESESFNDTQLSPGEYTIQIHALGSTPTHARLDFRAADVWVDLFLTSGVGQGPGLSLRLIEFPGPPLESPSVPPFEKPIPAPSPPEVLPPVPAPGIGPQPIVVVNVPSTTPDSSIPRSGTVRMSTAPAVTISVLALGTDL